MKRLFSLGDLWLNVPKALAMEAIIKMDNFLHSTLHSNSTELECNVECKKLSEISTELECNVVRKKIKFETVHKNGDNN